MENNLRKNGFNFFDEIALSYDYSIDKFPDRFINLLQNKFNINKKSKIVDLGCGTGYLAIALSKFSTSVEGVDFSDDMLKIAKNRDIYNKVKWTLSSVQNYDYGKNRNNLVISFESFHLFPNNHLIAEMSYSSLRDGGYFCVGWIKYHWENLIYDIYSTEFQSIGIDWGPESNLAIFDSKTLIEKVPILGQVDHDSVKIEVKTPINKIASFLASTHKTATIDKHRRVVLKEKLQNSIQNALKSDYSTGLDIYDIYYFRKRGT